MITFSDIDKIYLQTSNYIDSNKEDALTENYNKSATWINHPTLARWLYGSSREFLTNYQSACRKLNDATDAERKKISNWESILMEKLAVFSQELQTKYSNEPGFMEALSQ